MDCGVRRKKMRRESRTRGERKRKRKGGKHEVRPGQEGKRRRDLNQEEE